MWQNVIVGEESGPCTECTYIMGQPGHAGVAGAEGQQGRKGKKCRWYLNITNNWNISVCSFGSGRPENRNMKYFVMYRL